MFKSFMDEALQQTEHALKMGEIPVGAVIVYQNKIIASGHNLTITNNDPTAHAEIIAIRRAGHILNNYRLTDCDLYVTLEPCTMCAGALVLSRVDRVVYGAKDPKAGAVESLYQILSDSRLNHSAPVTGGILADECGEMLTSFFRRRRAKSVLT